MNKKEYLEAQRELFEERRKRKVRAWEVFWIGLRLFLLIFLYIVYFTNENFRIAFAKSPWAIWGVGALTVIVFYYVLDLFPDKKEKENEQNTN